MKTVRVRELVEKISELYRTERKEAQDLQDEIYSIDVLLGKVKRTKGKDITLEEYNQLIERKEKLKTEVDYKLACSQGIYDARELLMDYGFDAKVE